MEATNQIKIKLDKIGHYMNEVGKVRVFLFNETSPLFDFVIARQVVSRSSSLVLGGLVKGLLEWKGSRVRQRRL